MKRVNYIILDANFLMVPVQFRIDIYNELPITDMEFGRSIFIISRAVIRELKNKMAVVDSTKFKRDASKSLELLEEMTRRNPDRFVYIDDTDRPENMPIDDYLIYLAEKFTSNGKIVYIATNDKEIRKKAREKGLRLIIMRKKSMLTVEM